MNGDEKLTAKAVVYRLLDEMPVGYRFKGSYLMERVELITGKLHYPDTLLRMMRKYRRVRGRTILNVDKAKSIYEVFT
jgi:hypothetical protein